jgi:hypothetical protein
MLSCAVRAHQKKADPAGSAIARLGTRYCGFFSSAAAGAAAGAEAASGAGAGGAAGAAASSFFPQAVKVTASTAAAISAGFI